MPSSSRPPWADTLFYSVLPLAGHLISHLPVRRRLRRLPPHKLERSLRALKDRRNVLVSTRPRCGGQEVLGPCLVLEFDAPPVRDGWDLSPPFASATAISRTLSDADVRHRLAFSGNKSTRVVASTLDLGFDPRTPALDVARPLAQGLVAAAGANPHDPALDQPGQFVRAPCARWYRLREDQTSVRGDRWGSWSVWFERDDSIPAVRARAQTRPPVWLPHDRWWGDVRRPTLPLPSPGPVSPSRSPEEAAMGGTYEDDDWVRWPRIERILAALGVEVRGGRLRCPDPDHDDSEGKPFGDASVWRERNAVCCWSHPPRAPKWFGPVLLVCLVLELDPESARRWLHRLHNSGV